MSPTISMFYGIKITMYKLDHNPPHIHAEYGDYSAAICIDNGQMTDGRLPNKALSMVRERIAIHRDELTKNRNTLLQEGTFFKIEPLE